MRLQVTIYSICVTSTILVLGCSQPKAKSEPVASRITQPMKTTQGVVNQANSASDEHQFRQFLKQFKTTVKQKNRKQITALCNFPLQTAPQWTSEDLRQGTVDKTGGLVNKSEFANYYNDIFRNDVVRLIPKSTEEELSEIDRNTTEDYYKTLSKVTDKASTLYELQIQYTQDNGNETSFGFVFGKVQGQYKVIGYYNPWPVKD